ncbi:helix-turn-helix transcriptional regulator [Oceanicola sp. S124]|uniref:helix-turn-helix transcriptional regulator n=1 Tax=Oceanicola sp. S124 TaxID=1042378 RepID=UPI0002558516|nr:LuxR C-terminal-related transcriptional regulator [Oceanicola sp. S124]
MSAAARHVDALQARMGAGVLGLVYDYSPVPFSPDPARFTLPEVIEARGAAERLLEDWCGRALYRADPVQGRAARLLHPFYWSYHAGEPSEIGPDLARADVGEVRERLLSWGLGRGMTVPLHLPGRGFATLSAFLDAPADADRLAHFALDAFRLQDRISAGRAPDRGPLSPREAECLAHTAEGLSAKQIAHALGRSESMVVKHLQAAGAKLGARNRSHAVAIATRQGWIA